LSTIFSKLERFSSKTRSGFDFRLDRALSIIAVLRLGEVHLLALDEHLELLLRQVADVHQRIMHRSRTSLSGALR
jgi:hypothetical protein